MSITADVIKRWSLRDLISTSEEIRHEITNKQRLISLMEDALQDIQKELNNRKTTQ